VSQSQALLQKRKAREKRYPPQVPSHRRWDEDQQEAERRVNQRREHILRKWTVFTERVYEQGGKLYIFHEAAKVHIRDLKDCLQFLCEIGEQNGKEEAIRTEASNRKIKDCTEKFLAVSAECSELRKKLRESKKRLSV
jgi:hypothetical protein